MKIKSFIMLLILILFSCMACFTGCNSNKNVTVIILAGQSNMVGVSERSDLKSVVGEKTYNELITGYKNIEMYSVINLHASPTPKFEQYKLGVGTSDDNYFGLEVGICETLNKNINKKIYIIKAAFGGTSLNNDWNADSFVYSLFKSTVRNGLNELKDKKLNPKIKAMCWMQGESDYGGFEQYYYNNLVNLKNNIEEEFYADIDVNGLNFIDTTIQFDGEINEAKKQFAQTSDNNYYIDTDIYDIVENGVKGLIIGNPMHYNAKSEVVLGKLFGEKLVEILKK